jgi:hypothetical protein
MKKLLFILFSLCIGYQNTAQVTILPVFGDKPITENMWFITKNGDSLQFDNIRFYLSDIEFEMNDKSVVKDTVKAHLIDIFKLNSLKIALPTMDFKRIKMLRFNIGIDSLTNVSGALSGDLDPQRGMYWAWQSGYINLKIEGRSPQSKNRKHVFQYHIGGYLSPFYAIRHVELPILGIYTEGSLLTINFAKFFENIVIFNQNSIMIPCKEAMQLADEGVKMFSITSHEK